MIERKPMQPQLPQFDRARVLIVGDIMLDRYYAGAASRISPEAPVPVVRVDDVSERPGGAGNVALNIAALGGRARLAGYAGDDDAADTVEGMLAATGVDCRIVRQAGRTTVTKLRVIARHQQLLRLDFEDAAPAPAPAFSGEAAAALLEGCNALVLSDYAKGALAAPGTLIDAARARGVPVLVDPRGSDLSRYRGATLLTPNLRELEAAVGPCESEAALVAGGLRLLSDLQLHAVLVTRGERGMTLLRAGFEPLHLPAHGREVYDVTGAGDTVIGALAAALAAGADLVRAVALANTAAGLAVGRLGAAAISAPELRRALSGSGGTERGVVSLEQLQAALGRARQRGERVVFTNGCFDLLHAGHVGCLDQARRLGDRRVVAVNSDAAVRRLKGAGRPLNSLARRMAVLAALESVDWVVGFDGDTPQELLETLRPDVLVKGGDYRRKEDVVGRDIVESYGGQVCLTEEIDGASTSDIVGSILHSSEH